MAARITQSSLEWSEDDIVTHARTTLVMLEYAEEAAAVTAVSQSSMLTFVGP